MNVINLARKTQLCHKIFLLPILEDIYRMLESFDSSVLNHVYMDRNMVADSMPKEILQSLFGQ